MLGILGMLGVMIGGILITLVLASVISCYRFRKEFGQKYQIHPELNRKFSPTEPVD